MKRPNKLPMILVVAPVIATLAMACQSEPRIQADRPVERVAAASAALNQGCPKGLPGPEMVEVRAPSDAKYCMDRTEVSQKDYYEFMSAFLEDPIASGQKRKVDAGAWPSGPGCEWNDRLRPSRLEGGACSTTPTALDYNNRHPDYPAACVDWCDAYAYCAWAGKRLCGRVGGGQLDPSESSSPDNGEWFNVCSQGGRTQRGYGNQHDPSIPQVRSSKPEDRALPVDSGGNCRGTTHPFSEIVGVGCNVSEWQNSCVARSSGMACAVHVNDASGRAPDEYSRCANYLMRNTRSTVQIDVGFRCCHD